MLSLLVLGAGAASAPKKSPKCPGSKAWLHHASCQLSVTFPGTSCADVYAEMTDRIAGRNGWVDPHNAGKYTVMAGSVEGKELHSKRVTGNKKYTDLQLFEFSEFSAPKECVMTACSESQVTSYLDISTNYCNLHELYCGSADGCKFVTSDLKYAEVINSCKQHDKGKCHPSKPAGKFLAATEPKKPSPGQHVAQQRRSTAPRPGAGEQAATRGDDGRQVKIRLEGVRTLPKHVGKECTVSMGPDPDQTRTGTFVMGSLRMGNSPLRMGRNATNDTAAGNSSARMRRCAECILRENVVVTPKSDMVGMIVSSGGVELGRVGIDLRSSGVDKFKDYQIKKAGVPQGRVRVQLVNAGAPDFAPKKSRTMDVRLDKLFQLPGEGAYVVAVNGVAMAPKQAAGSELVLHDIVKVSDELPSQLYKTSKDVVRVALFRSSKAPGNLVGRADVSVAAAAGFQKFPLVHEGKQTAEIRLQIVSRRDDGLEDSRRKPEKIEILHADEEDEVTCDLAKVRVDRIFNVPEANATYFVTVGGVPGKHTPRFGTLPGQNKGVSDVLLREAVQDVPFVPLDGIPLLVWRADSNEEVEEVGRARVHLSRTFDTYALQLDGQTTDRLMRVQVVDKTRKLPKAQAKKLGCFGVSPQRRASPPPGPSNGASVLV